MQGLYGVWFALTFQFPRVGCHETSWPQVAVKDGIYKDYLAQKHQGSLGLVGHKNRMLFCDG